MSVYNGWGGGQDKVAVPFRISVTFTESHEQHNQQISNRDSPANQKQFTSAKRPDHSLTRMLICADPDLMNVCGCGCGHAGTKIEHNLGRELSNLITVLTELSLTTRPHYGLAGLEQQTP
ncbi:hypothetical protein Pcinc_023562 [Petrolisthes cinctipes]|uniref:Uncharacterized protein n=1 Tax=Petrolisthes cinctipes TaxID=88211 RepID=A0AAE1FDB0_PETCI|nr:hypothetical protein Pcinc_023562 [Petrolisthes cinctipes]